MRRSAENQEPAEIALEQAWPKLLALAAGQAAPDAAACPACPLWDLYAPIAEGRAASPFVFGQLGQSLDGRVATATGKSRYIGGPPAIRHLHRLRALADCVVVGVGTVTADDPQLNVREVAGPCPARVVIDPNFRLPRDARLLTDRKTPLYAIQGLAGARPEGVIPIVAPAQDGRIAPADIVAALAERGLRRILVEGGAATISTFLAAGALDRLHLAIAPLVIGSGPTGLNLPPIDDLTGALRPRAAVHRLGEDVLFDCAFDRD